MFTIFPQIIPKYNCTYCDIKTDNKKDYNKHLLTTKHQKVSKCLHNFPIIFLCSVCNKEYSCRQSLYSHKKKCIIKTEKIDKIVKEKDPNSEMIFFKNLVLDIFTQNQDLQKQMVELCQSNNNTVINNTNNSHNKTFNLQFFLNEQCKDAMNLMDFVKSFSLQLSDLENVTKLGYVEGITGIIVKKLNEMDVHKRPIHCSDAKREILYVREDNIWEKESSDNTRLRKAIKYISKKNRILLSEWSESHPEANDIHSSQNLEYMLMIVQAMGGKGELVDNENKIMKKIMKNVLIDKNNIKIFEK